MKVSNEIKQEVRSLISDATRSADKLINEAIPSCNTFNMTYLLGDADEARGAAAVLTKIYPEDKEIKQMWKDAGNIHILVYKGRDKFIEQCECKKK